ncbi:peptide ABC transporter permease [Bifidobacterium ramosum]|uniref:FtsX-like permease family protein n=1 Tax=Bifidobacterium ramosum TaxID=1798158 RepID=A0A6L4X0F7_9BIFI|nr:ABC transporter permease [Bifidobacterium ramosum]KAB8287879.1 peptide ABC transporter permease [Bifidobacterium ramosum]NEG71172.1 FtsX-like permease family protein [Bifidobacterium ramosum]
MRFADILHLCSQNLWRRKSRTILTVLGVIVGCCSIVTMVSIGSGINEMNEQSLKQMGDLTIINVYKQGNYDGAGTSDSTGAGQTEAKLDDKAIASFTQIPGVEGATAQMSLNYTVTMTADNGRYVATYGDIQAIDMSQLDNMGYKLTDGTAPTKDGEILAGQYLAYQFYDRFRPEGSNMRYQPQDAGDGTYWTCDATGNCSQVPADQLGEESKPFFDPMKTEITLTIQTGDDSSNGGGVTMGMGYSSGATDMGGTGSGTGSAGTTGANGANGSGNTFRLRATGVLKEDYNKGSATSSGVLMDISQLKAMLAKVDQSAAKTVTYEQALVKVADITQVSDVEQQIRDMGFSTSSYEEIRKQMEEQSRGIQLALGGIGAVSLLVAAIGITNTMVMSVTERTREIGIMKALGCTVRDIRVMFLGEAGFIGLLGGVAGCLISAVISLGINLVYLGGPGEGGENIWHAIVGGDGVTRLSVIPWWLFVFAILFSTLIGLVSGFQPANKAVRIPALDAIKNEQ